MVQSKPKEPKTGVRSTRLAMLLGLLAALSPIVACKPSNTTVTPADVSDNDVPLRAKMVWTGDYAGDIHPIFNQFCIECHGMSKAENGLRLDSYEGIMRGTQHGPVVVPGSPDTSTLVAVVEGTTAPQIRMPQGHRKLSSHRIDNIKLWIEAGAKNK